MPTEAFSDQLNSAVFPDNILLIITNKACRKYQFYTPCLINSVSWKSSKFLLFCFLNRKIPDMASLLKIYRRYSQEKILMNWTYHVWKSLLVYPSYNNWRILYRLQLVFRWIIIILLAILIRGYYQPKHYSGSITLKTLQLETTLNREITYWLPLFWWVFVWWLVI